MLKKLIIVFVLGLFLATFVSSVFAQRKTDKQAKEQKLTCCQCCCCCR